MALTIHIAHMIKCQINAYNQYVNFLMTLKLLQIPVQEATIHRGVCFSLLIGLISVYSQNKPTEVSGISLLEVFELIQGGFEKPFCGGL